MLAQCFSVSHRLLQPAQLSMQRAHFSARLTLLPMHLTHTHRPLPLSGASYSPLAMLGGCPRPPLMCYHHSAGGPGITAGAPPPAGPTALPGARPTVCISVMLSPLSRIRPTGFRALRRTDTSSASSMTRFMYSSNPMMRPSMRVSGDSYSHTRMRCFDCKKRKIKLIWIRKGAGAEGHGLVVNVREEEGVCAQRCKTCALFTAANIMRAAVLHTHRLGHNLLHAGRHLEQLFMKISKEVEIAMVAVCACGGASLRCWLLCCCAAANCVLAPS